MRLRSLTLSLAVLSSAAVLAVPEAAFAAGTQVGNACVASSPAANVTVVMTGRSVSNPLPVAAPTSGVVTQAAITLPGGVPGTYPTKLKIVRANAAPDTFTVQAESGLLNAAGGTQTFDVRLPIATGDLLGLGGPNVLACETGQVADTIALAGGDSAVGAAVLYASGTKVALPVVVTVEPDADHDGYDDLSQDSCAESAKTQAPCPKVKLDSKASTQGASISVLVTADNAAKVKITGVAKVGGKKVKLKSGAKTVRPGTLSSFKVKVPAALRAALATLRPSQGIKISLVATATDSIGRTSTSKSHVRLPGTK